MRVQRSSPSASATAWTTARPSCRVVSSSASRSRERSVTEPALLLADEPTGNLDTATGEEIMGLLEGIQRERGMALVVITHEPEIARRAKRRIELRDGLIVADGASGAVADGASA